MKTFFVVTKAESYGFWRLEASDLEDAKNMAKAAVGDKLEGVYRASNPPKNVPFGEFGVIVDGKFVWHPNAKAFYASPKARMMRGR